MEKFTRIVLGYHGCKPSFAEALLRGEKSVDDWQPSKNPYDWLGHGIYSWEFAPFRAKKWSSGGAVIGAVIHLGLCLDLTDVNYTELLCEEYKEVRRARMLQHLGMPKNEGKRRDLDCLVINELVMSMDNEKIRFQTVRCSFLEGKRAYPGSGIFRESHIQIAVRDKGCILGIFRPNT